MHQKTFLPPLKRSIFYFLSLFFSFTERQWFLFNTKGIIIIFLALFSYLTLLYISYVGIKRWLQRQVSYLQEVLMCHVILNIHSVDVISWFRNAMINHGKYQQCRNVLVCVAWQRCVKYPFWKDSQQQIGNSVHIHIMIQHYEGFYYCTVRYQRGGQTFKFTRRLNVTAVCEPPPLLHNQRPRAEYWQWLCSFSSDFCA